MNSTIEKAWDNAHEREEAFANACRRFVSKDLLPRHPEDDDYCAELHGLLHDACDAAFEYWSAIDSACELEKAEKAE